MTWQRLTIAASLLAAGLSLWACTVAPVVPRDPVVVEAHVAKQMCDVAPLAEERDTYIRSVDDMERSTGVGAGVNLNVGPIGAGANAGVGTTVSQSGDSDTEHRYTILHEKLRDYRAEIDASYRFVTMNCAAYNLCLEHGAPCDAQRGALLESQDKFDHLAVELAKIDKGDHEHKHHRVEGYAEKLGVMSDGCCGDH